MQQRRFQLKIVKISLERSKYEQDTIGLILETVWSGTIRLPQALIGSNNDLQQNQIKYYYD